MIAATTPAPRTRIRCKMCRQVLAIRKDMVDHGQLAPPAPPPPPPPSGDVQDTDEPNIDAPLSPQNLKRSDAILPAAVSADSPPPTTTATTTASPAGPPNTLPPSDSPARGEDPASASNDGDDASALAARSMPALRPPVTPVRPAPPPPPPPPRPAGGTRARGEPILLSAACSGYFLEPLPWMDPFLHGGESTGKIICPNKKCNAKLGNYDWAGVHCGCREWVTPGFCVNRSKVDEIA